MFIKGQRVRYKGTNQWGTVTGNQITEGRPVAVKFDGQVWADMIYETENLMTTQLANTEGGIDHNRLENDKVITIQTSLETCGRGVVGVDMSPVVLSSINTLVEVVVGSHVGKLRELGSKSNQKLTKAFRFVI